MKDNKDFDFVIVGSGLFGATFARLAADSGLKCVVLERRFHPGGNVRCEEIGGINVHIYGPHIFHTSNEEVWNFVNSHCVFNRFTNAPLARYHGKTYNLPFNMNTFRQLWGVTEPEEAERILDAQRREQIELLKSSGANAPRNLEEQALCLAGREIYETLIKEYTEKQWGRRCADLPASIIKRLPLRLTYNNNYFDDIFQGVPVGGYNPLIASLLRGIRVETGVDFLKNSDYWRGRTRKVVFTGCIDEYFNYRFGRLQYRTVRFETDILDTPNFQGNAVVNYTDALHPFTRIIEHKHFEALTTDMVYRNPKTVVSREYPEEWKEPLEPFYPVNDYRNESLLLRYKELANREPDTIFGGRLGQYRYYDMDDVIEEAMKAFNKTTATF